MNALKNKTALITGASSGVGEALARRFAAAGVAVSLVGRNPERLQAVVQTIRASGGMAQEFRADLDEDVALEQLARNVAAQSPRLDFLIHSAGIFRRGATADAPVSDLDALYRTNVRVPYLLTQKLLPNVVAARGTIVFINSGAGERAFPQLGQYAASKFALRAIADALCMEMSECGVRVLSVMLGRTATPMQEEVCRLEGSQYDARKFLHPDDVAESIFETVTTAEHIDNLTLRPAFT